MKLGMRFIYVDRTQMKRRLSSGLDARGILPPAYFVWKVQSELALLTNLFQHSVG